MEFEGSTFWIQAAENQQVISAETMKWKIPQEEKRTWIQGDEATYNYDNLELVQKIKWPQSCLDLMESESLGMTL